MEKYFLIFFSLLFSGILSAQQELVGKIEHLNEYKSMCKDLQNSIDSYNNYQVSIEKISGLKEIISSYGSKFEEFNTTLKSLVARVNETEREQISITSSNLKSSPGLYTGKTVIVEGTVAGIEQSSDGKIFLRLNNGINCYFSQNRSKELKTASLGSSVFVKGSVSGSSLNNSFFFHKKNLIEDKSRIVANIRSFLNLSLELIEKEITSSKQELNSDLTKYAESAYGKGDYKTALNYFLQIKNSGINYSELDKKIEDCKDNINYFKAQQLYDSGYYLNAYYIFGELSQKRNLHDSKNLFQTSFAKNYSNNLKTIITSSDIAKYFAFFDSLYKYKNYFTSGFYDSLKTYYKESLKNNARLYFEDDLTRYCLIPSGSYYVPLTGNKVKVKGFLISPVSVNQDFVSAYNIIYGKSISVYSTGSIDKYIFTVSDRENIKEWIGLDFLEESEKEYINSDGWRSVEEKKLFTNYSDLLKADDLPLNRCLKIKIEDIKEEKLREQFEAKDDIIKAEVNRKLSDRKEYAYNSGRMREYFQFSFTPQMHYSYGRESMDVKSIHSLKDSTLNVSSGGIAAGISLGILLSRHTSGEFDPGQSHISPIFSKFAGSYLNLTYIYSKAISDPRTEFANSDVDDKKYPANNYAYTSQEMSLDYYTPELGSFRIMLGLGYTITEHSLLFQDKVNSEEMSYSEKMNTYFAKAGVAISILEFKLTLAFPKQSGNSIRMGFDLGLTIPFWFDRIEPLYY